jgi:N-acetylneuraminate synthase
MVYFIAEIGINHNGDLHIAKRLIDAAFACGWDCVKFQKRNPDVCVPESQKNIIRDTIWGGMTYLRYKHKIEFSKAEYDYIDKYCREKPINWSASVWDIDSLIFMQGYDVPFIKVPSAMVTNTGLLREIVDWGIPIILSTGMSTWQELDMAVMIMQDGDAEFTLMHTNSSYPTPRKELNLNLIPELRKRYGCTVGYSGHEYDLEPTVIAVALGAEVIERHITLSHDMWGTDQKASLEVHAMDLLKKRCEDIPTILGSNKKCITESELPIREKLRLV